MSTISCATGRILSDEDQTKAQSTAPGSIQTDSAPESADHDAQGTKADPAPGPANDETRGKTTGSAHESARGSAQAPRTTPRSKLQLLPTSVNKEKPSNNTFKCANSEVVTVNTLSSPIVPTLKTSSAPRKVNLDPLIVQNLSCLIILGMDMLKKITIGESSVTTNKTLVILLTQINKRS